MQYRVPPPEADEALGCPVSCPDTPPARLPVAAPAWAAAGAALLEPPLPTSLESDRQQRVAAIVPGAVAAALVPAAPADTDQGIADGRARALGALPDGAIPLATDMATGAIEAEINTPRCAALDLCVQLAADADSKAAGGWRRLLRLPVAPQGQVMRARPDLANAERPYCRSDSMFRVRAWRRACV